MERLGSRRFSIAPRFADMTPLPMRMMSGFSMWEECGMGKRVSRDGLASADLSANPPKGLCGRNRAIPVRLSPNGLGSQRHFRNAGNFAYRISTFPRIASGNDPRSSLQYEVQAESGDLHPFRNSP